MRMMTDDVAALKQRIAELEDRVASLGDKLWHASAFVYGDWHVLRRAFTQWDVYKPSNVWDCLMFAGMHDAIGNAAEMSNETDLTWTGDDMVEYEDYYYNKIGNNKDPDTFISWLKKRAENQKRSAASP